MPAQHGYMALDVDLPSHQPPCEGWGVPWNRILEPHRVQTCAETADIALLLGNRR
jgi:hypothetical protein